jgi:hypothetical protein
MSDDETPNPDSTPDDDEPKTQPEVMRWGSGGGSGGRPRRRTRIGTGGNDDDDWLRKMVENGFLTPEEWDLIQLEHQRTNEPMAFILTRLGLASENHIKNALELQYGVNYVNLSNLEEVTDECLATLSPWIVKRHRVVPIAFDGKKLVLAMINPNNLLALDDVEISMKGISVKPVVCTEESFTRFMLTRYRKFDRREKADSD